MKNRPKSIVNFKYIAIIAFLTILLGYEITELLIKGSYIDNLTSFNNNLLNNPGAHFFINNNISFFLVVSVLPFINLPIMLIQLFISGIHARLIANLPLDNQIEIFYRHFIFEFMALCLAIYISGLLYSLLKNMHSIKRYNVKNDLVYIIFLYVIIVIFTIIAALLEGGAFA